MLSEATDVLSLVDGIRPNDLDASLKARWLREVEGTVRVEILGESPFSMDLGDPLTLTAPVPYDRLYVWYLCAMIDLVQGDAALYRNDAQAYNEALSDYAKWMVRHPKEA